MTIAEPILETSPLSIDDIVVPKGYELVNGELVEKPNVSNLAVWVSNEVFVQLREWNRSARVGVVLPPESEFACFPDRPYDLRKPDGAFVVGRFETFIPTDEKYKFAPDLVLEVLSPTNRVRDMFNRFTDYFSAGTRLIWMIDPLRREAYVYHPDFSSRKVAENESLSGEDVMPGFVLPLSEVLPPKMA